MARYKRDLWDYAPMLVALLAFILLCAFSVVVSSWTCHKSWDDSRFPVRWSVTKGCQLQTNDGWVPAEKYRVN